jgi:hypothetical protein
MDSFNLKAASSYLNNLLLARGLLRNGKSIQFARPSKGEGGTEATMAQVINIVHDMILRRDVRRLRDYHIFNKLMYLSSANKSNVMLLQKLLGFCALRQHAIHKLLIDWRRAMKT